MFVNCIPSTRRRNILSHEDYATNVLLRLDELGRDCLYGLACSDRSKWRPMDVPSSSLL